MCYLDILLWLRWLVTGLSPRSLGFDSWSVHVRFVVAKEAQGHLAPSTSTLPYQYNSISSP